jgi:hypothetical protein
MIIVAFCTHYLDMDLNAATCRLFIRASLVNLYPVPICKRKIRVEKSMSVSQIIKGYCSIHLSLIDFSKNENIACGKENIIYICKD